MTLKSIVLSSNWQVVCSVTVGILKIIGLLLADKPLVITKSQLAGFYCLSGNKNMPKHLIEAFKMKTIESDQCEGIGLNLNEKMGEAVRGSTRQPLYLSLSLA